MNDLTCRIYHKAKNKMYYCRYDDLVGWSDGSVFLSPKDGPGIVINDAKDREIIDIQLYAGFKDCENVKIFEDDYVRFLDTGVIYKLKYLPEFASFVFVEYGTLHFLTLREMMKTTQNFGDVSKRFKILGNIWENQNGIGEGDQHRFE